MQLQTIGLVVTLALAILTAPLAAAAQSAGKVYRVGILGNKTSDPAEARLWQVLRLGLRERGWIEGGNLLLDYRWAEGNFARLPELAADLVRIKVDLIVAWASIWVQAAKEATASIPIVFLTHADPVGLGHVASLAKPGGNITGLSEVSRDTEAKRLEFLKEIDPRITRVAVLWHPDTPSNPPRLKAVEEAGRTLQLQLQVIGARAGAELEGVFSSMAREHAQAVLVLSSSFVLAERHHLTELAMRHRLPTMLSQKEPVEAGGLMSYGPDFADLYRRGAIYVDKILKGARPADLPVEQAMKFDLLINLKTAQALGITIPPVLLFQATEVIQ